MAGKSVNCTWAVPVSYEVFPYLAGVTLREFHLDPARCARAFRLGKERIQEIFGENISVPTCFVPPLSYYHEAFLGSDIIFPENGAPTVKPIYFSMDEGIQALRSKGKSAFQDNQWVRYHLRMREYLEKVFPGEKMSYIGFGAEGPLTSAVLLRGQDFFMDLYDCPDKVKEFLGMLTDSIVRFNHCCKKLNGKAEIAPEGQGLCDDFAAFVPPALWPEFVLPYWEQYYRGTTTGPRSLHCEDLSPRQLAYFKSCDISSFDPDKSSKLSPSIIAANIDIPFSWSLQSFDYPAMTREDVERWVVEAITSGATHIYSYIYVNMCAGDTPGKVRTFIETARRVQSGDGETIQ